MSKKKKIQPWRIILFPLSLLFIVFLWVRKDVVEIYKTMPSDQIAPLIATTVAVSLLKVGAIAGGVLLLQWIIKKIRSKSK